MAVLQQATAILVLVMQMDMEEVVQLVQVVPVAQEDQQQGQRAHFYKVVEVG